MRRRPIVLALALAFMAGCGTRARKRVPGAPGGPEGSAGRSDETVKLGFPQAGTDGPEGEVAAKEADIRAGRFETEAALQPVRFAYDQFGLDEDARRALKANADLMRKSARADFQIEGHCDERGTSEYNLALGQRRAKAVRDFYKALGISVGRMSTISYGKERPSCRVSTDSCHAENRRGETLIRRK